MDQNQTSVIVALIPTDDSWCKIEPAHMTIIYVGETTDLKVNRFNELAKDVSSIAMLSNPIMAKVSGTDVFGEEEKVDVMLISPTPEILAIRRMLMDWDNGSFPDFEPHVTVGPEGSMMDWNFKMNSDLPYPMYLNFDRIAVFWGADRINFWLKKY
jgi:2'-5' RNA ligase